jgi:hypothetical protein
VIGDNEEAASSCGWDILSQAVHGASRSMFCEAHEIAFSSSSLFAAN